MAGETLSAARGFALGLVDEVREEPEFDAAVTAVTKSIVAAAPSSVRTIKRLVRGDELGALEQALATEGAAQIQALQSPEFHRRLEAFASR
jgi:crotonobetainyl-CoA hydratase